MPQHDSHKTARGVNAGKRNIILKPVLMDRYQAFWLLRVDRLKKMG